MKFYLKNQNLHLNIYIISTLFLMCSLFSSAPIFSQILKTEISETINESEFIVHAKVVNINNIWKNDSRGKHIYSIYKLQTIENYKGLNEEYFSLEIMGGKVGDTTEIVSPSIHLRENEEVVLFLNGDPLRINDFNYGKLSVIDNQVLLEGKIIPIDYLERAIKNTLAKPEKNRTTQEFLNNIISLQKYEDSLAIWAVELKCQNSYPINNNTLNKPAMESKPNLTFIQPQGWPAKVVISKKQKTNSNDIIYTVNSLYIDCCVANTGDVTSGEFNISYYIDNILKSKGRIVQGISKNNSQSFEDISISSLTEGTHVLRIVVDIEDIVKESNEQDNELYYTFQVVKASGTPPEIINITPLSASAGTGSQITILGNNFGNTSEDGSVEFFYRTSASKISADILSWSNNKIICTVPAGIITYYRASASSGPINVIANNLLSNSIDFKVTFGYSGSKWKINPLTIKFKVNENKTGIPNITNEIISASKEWNKKKSNLVLQYSGSTTSTVSSGNGVNEILFNSLSQGIIAQANSYITNNTVDETDITFNSTLNIGTNMENDKFDLRTIAQHEFGHWFGLLDLYGESDRYKTMHGFGNPGLIKRTISDDDGAGAIWIYGSKQYIQYTIAGRIMNNGIPLSNVKVSLSGDFERSFVTGENGEYSFSVDSGFTYTISASKAGYSFMPENKTISDLSENRRLDFEAFQSNSKIMITGIVTYMNNALPGVLVHLSGSSSELVLTDINGKYSFEVPVNGDYRITPYKTGYYFTPHYVLLNNAISNKMQNFSSSVTYISKTPDLLFPKNNFYGIGKKLSFSWIELLDVTGYELQISTDSNFINMYAICDSIYSNKYSVEGFTENSTFYWRVRGINGKDQGNWSEVRKYLTASSDIPKPNIIYPVNNSEKIETDVTLKWTKIESASSYDVILSDNPDMSNIIKTYDYLEEPLVKVVNLKSNVSYYWCVLARKGQATGEWSEINKFSTWESVADVKHLENKPVEYSLSQNYPNPFNPSTIINYSIANSSFVTIKIFDIFGREVQTIISKSHPTGKFSIKWEPKNITSGIYYYQIITSHFRDTKKMIFLR